MPRPLSRRDFNIALASALMVAATPALSTPASKPAEEWFSLALTSWTFHMPLWRGEMRATDLPQLAKGLGIDALEWTTKTFTDLKGGREQMFKVPPAAFFRELRQAVDDAGMSSELVGAGGPFYLATPDRARRQQAVDFFAQYAEPAQILGARILRAELYCDLPPGPNRAAEAHRLAIAGLEELLTATEKSGLVINVENHHGISSDADWLAGLVRAMNHERIGLTADTNNFRIDQDMPYSPNPDAIPRYADRYQGLRVLAPVANWVSAKTYAFDGSGYETSLNYPLIIQILREAGFNRHVSIEYEGAGDPVQGVKQSVAMLQRLREHYG